MPKVSVIIPVYNVEQYLRECLDSVVIQTLKDIEIICVNDGSTDRSLDILKEYAANDNRIKIIDKENSGAGAARNAGLEIAAGEYLYFLDSDDYIDSCCLEKLYNQCIKENAEICICRCRNLEDDTKKITINEHSLVYDKLPNKTCFSRKDIPGGIFQICLIGIWIKLYKTDFIKASNIKFKELKTVNDVFFNNATLALANYITYINEPLVTYRVNRQNSLTSQRSGSIENLLISYNSLKDLFINKNIFEELKDSFYKRAILSFKFEISLCIDENTKNRMNNLFKSFVPAEYWEKYVIDKKKNSCKIKNLLQILFSCVNNSSHKVITICGIKFKFKLKRKCKKVINFKTFPDMCNIIKKGISKLPSDIDLIVGVPRSGIIPAYMIALLLNKKVCSLPEFIAGLIPENGERIINQKNKAIKNVLIVDDSILTGNALRKVQDKLSGINQTAYNIKFLAIFATKSSKNLVDYYLEIVKSPRLFQWNYLNHQFVAKWCYDMDGVLCADPTPEQNDDGEKYIDFCLNAKPLYIPSYTINSIVTSRLEKYRKETEIWLKKNNVMYEHLYMLNSTAEKRRKEKLHAIFKASVYKKLEDCELFLESNNEQAKEIFNLTNKTVICVETDIIYK